MLAQVAVGPKNVSIATAIMICKSHFLTMSKENLLMT
jgi:hypothetical protein